MYANVACIRKKNNQRFTYIMSILIALCLVYVQKAGWQTEVICEAVARPLLRNPPAAMVPVISMLLVSVCSSVAIK